MSLKLVFYFGEIVIFRVDVYIWKSFDKIIIEYCLILMILVNVFFYFLLWKKIIFLFFNFDLYIKLGMFVKNR